MHVTPQARTILTMATDVARFRGAERCTTSDVALALVLHDDLCPRAQLYPDAERSPAPRMLPFDPDLENLLGSDGAVGVDELRAVCAAERSALAARLLA